MLFCVLLPKQRVVSFCQKESCHAACPFSWCFHAVVCPFSWCFHAAVCPFAKAASGVMPSCASSCCSACSRLALIVAQNESAAQLLETHNTPTLGRPLLDPAHVHLATRRAGRARVEPFPPADRLKLPSPPRGTWGKQGSQHSSRSGRARTAAASSSCCVYINTPNPELGSGRCFLPPGCAANNTP